MEFLPPPSTKSKSHLARKSSLEPLLPPDNGPQEVVEKTREYLDTTVDVHRQSLPPYPNVVKDSLQSRQNSLPSSLDSKELSTPSPPPHSSKSYDSFKASNRYSANIETLPCMVCGQVEHTHERDQCVKGMNKRQSQLTEAEEDELSHARLKSKSMPTVCPPGFHSSQTVLRADVHKEWGDHESRVQKCRQGSISDSQDSNSNKDLALDDLEKDIQSIIMPQSMKWSTNRHSFEKYEGPSQYIKNISNGGDVIPKISNLPLSPLRNSSTSSSIGSLEERMCQVHDIKL